MAKLTYEDNIFVGQARQIIFSGQVHNCRTI